MSEQTLLHRTFQCWNKPESVEAGKFVHLSARGVWIDGRVIVTAVQATEAMVVECSNARCEVDVDEGWITVIVHGPCTIPARAKVCVKIRAEIAHAPWLAEVEPKPEPQAETLL